MISSFFKFSSEIACNYAIAENVALFEERGSSFFTSDLTASVWEWWDRYERTNKNNNATSNGDLQKL